MPQNHRNAKLLKKQFKPIPGMGKIAFEFLQQKIIIILR